MESNLNFYLYTMEHTITDTKKLNIRLDRNQYQALLNSSNLLLSRYGKNQDEAFQTQTLHP